LRRRCLDASDRWPARVLRPLRPGHLPGSRACRERRRRRHGGLRVTAGSLLANLRARGLRVERVGSALHVAPRAAVTDADRTAIREYLVELKALVQAEADAALVTALFGDGVRVVSSGPVGPWPPPGPWVPTSARTIDVYGAEMPTVPCPCCRALDWHR